MLKETHLSHYLDKFQILPDIVESVWKTHFIQISAEFFQHRDQFYKERLGHQNTNNEAI